MANISRTAQLSIAQIMAGLEENPTPSAGPAPAPEAPQHDSAADDEDDEPQDTIPQALGRGVFGMFKWLLLVVLFVLIIAGGGVAWLYRSATPDMLPEVKVTFDDQELAPTAYKWHVPVVGSFFRRTYAETLNASPVVLEDAISDASPDIIVTPSDYSTQLTITDADKETVYEGSVTGFRSYLFAENGTFDAKLVVTASDSAAEDSSSVTGTETWQFRFTVGIKPSVTLCTPTVQQGSVAAVRVGSTMSQTEPTLTGPLESTGFVRAANGWICYLPIPWNAETGNTELTVTADGYTETLTLSVRAASYSYKDYSTKSQLTSPYIGADDAPDAVRRLLTNDGGEIQWAMGGFVQPFLDSFDTPLLYGMTEYVGRSYSERSTNYGYGGRDKCRHQAEEVEGFYDRARQRPCAAGRGPWRQLRLHRRHRPRRGPQEHLLRPDRTGRRSRGRCQAGPAAGHQRQDRCGRAAHRHRAHQPAPRLARPVRRAEILLSKKASIF